MPSPSEPLRVAGIVLAAGAARRMGSNKMRLRLDGEPLVRRAARRALAAGLHPVVVVLGRDAGEVRAEVADLPCEFVVNEDFTGPTSGSLHLGLALLPDAIEGAVIVLGDMVDVTDSMIRALVDAGRTTPTPLVVSRYGDVTAPPLLFRRSLFPELLAWTGEGCGKAVVQRHRDEAVFLDWPAAALADVDTPEEFERRSSVYSRQSSVDRRP
jgi:CTP:molybdopterin cytidylyltransferase MocA